MRSSTSLSTLALLASVGSVLAQNDTNGGPFEIPIDLEDLGDISLPDINNLPEFECAEGLQIFISRGTGEPAGPGESGKLGEAIAERIPGSNITANPYPAAFADPVYFISIWVGDMWLKAMLTSYVATCPDSKVAVIGYSGGAQVTTNNFCGSPTIWGGTEAFPQEAVEKNVVAIALFGDPTFRHDNSFSRGTGEGHGVFLRNNDTACEALGDRIVSFCDAGDPYCDLSTTSLEGIHETYLDRYADDVEDWIVERYETGEGAFPARSAGGGGHDNSTEHTTPTPSGSEEEAGATDVPAAAAMVGPGMALAAMASVFAVGLM